MSFTPAELRLLAISDRALGGGGRVPGPRRGGRPSTGKLGRLTDVEAIAFHEKGLTIAQMAQAADCSCDRVSEWRRLRGLSRPYNRKADS